MRISDWSSDVCSSDLSQVPADFGAWFQVLDPSGVVQHEEPRAEFDFARYEPDPHQTFAFAGQVRTQILSSDLLASEMVVYPGLRYERTEGGYHVLDRKSTRLNYSP